MDNPIKLAQVSVTDQSPAPKARLVSPTPGMTVRVIIPHGSGRVEYFGVVAAADRLRMLLGVPSTTKGGSLREVWLPLALVVLENLQLTPDQFICEYAIGGKLHLTDGELSLTKLEIPALITQMTDQDALMRIFAYDWKPSGGLDVNATAARPALKPEYIVQRLLEAASGVRDLSERGCYSPFEHFLKELPPDRLEVPIQVATCATNGLYFLYALERIHDQKVMIGLVEKKLDEGVVVDPHYRGMTLRLLRERECHSIWPSDLLKRLADELDLFLVATCLPPRVNEELYKELLLNNPSDDLPNDCANELLSKVTDLDWLETLIGRRQFPSDDGLIRAVAKRLRVLSSEDSLPSPV